MWHTAGHCQTCCTDLLVSLQRGCFCIDINTDNKCEKHYRQRSTKQLHSVQWNQVCQPAHMFAMNFLENDLQCWQSPDNKKVGVNRLQAFSHAALLSDDFHSELLNSGSYISTPLLCLFSSFLHEWLRVKEMEEVKKVTCPPTMSPPLSGAEKGRASR